MFDRLLTATSSCASKLKAVLGRAKSTEPTVLPTGCRAGAPTPSSVGLGELEAAFQRAEREAWSAKTSPDPGAAPGPGATKPGEARVPAAGGPNPNPTPAKGGPPAGGSRAWDRRTPEVLRSADDVRGNGDGMAFLQEVVLQEAARAKESAEKESAGGRAGGRPRKGKG